MNYDKLVKALRCKRDDCEGGDLAFLDNDEGWICQYAAKDDDAADAIEALYHQTDILANAIKLLTEGRERLLSQLPKRGEWITIRLNNGGSYTGCSCCEAPIPTDTMLDYIPESESKYCYSCGAKMEVQE